MKKILAFLIITCSCQIKASAVTIAIGAGFGASQGVMAQSISGYNLSAGGYFVAVGTYTSVPQITDIPSLQKALADFLEFGSSTTSSSGTTVGKIASSITSIPSDPSVFNTKEIYMIIGNGKSKAEASEFAIIRGATAWTFPGDTAAGGTNTISLASVASFQVVGIAGMKIDNPGVDGLRLGIPESSVGMLAGVSLLGFCAFRRR